MKITMTKDASAKLVDADNKAVIDLLKSDGWKVEGEKEPENDTELAELRAQAEALGLKVHHKAGADKIRQMIEEAA